MRSLLATVLIMTIAGAQGTEPDNSSGLAPLRVLLIYPTDLVLQAGLFQDVITKAAIREAVPRPVEFFEEGLDATSAPIPELETQFVALLRKRYDSAPPNLIVAHGEMEGFVTRQRAKLWPQSAWMFVGVGDQQARLPGFPAGIPGTTVRVDIAGTVDLALRLQPDAKRLVVVAGNDDIDRSEVAYFAPILDSYRRRLTIEYPLAQSIESLTRMVSALPPDSIVLQLTVLRDTTGRRYVPRDVMGLIASAASVPTYTYTNIGMGEGVVGGSLLNWEAQKPLIGQIARELLLGGPKKASLLMHPPLPPLCVVDWRQILRWHIPSYRVPETCLRQFREPTFWERYRTQAILIGLLVVLESGLIVALLVQRRRRVRAEAQADEQRNQLLHAARLATAGELIASIAHEIIQPLQAILSSAEGGQQLIDCGTADLTELRESLTSIVEADERAVQVINHLRQLLRKQEVEMRLVDINEAIDAILEFVAGTARASRVVIKKALDRTIPRIQGDPIQLQQVLLNLTTNALAAMTDVPMERRQLTVTTVERPKGNVEVTINDRGSGIAAEHLEKVFEPFFSTKREGMGLGLHICRSIVRAHGGKIWVDSTTEGTTFHFDIPVAAKRKGELGSSLSAQPEVLS